MKLYADLAAWWPLMSTPEEYAEEAAVIAALLDPGGDTTHRVLELGSGGGHLASHLKARFQMVLVDISAQMLDLSRHLNPECQHLLADMRHVRLDEQFDAVLIFDAISHLYADEDLRAALATARAHLRHAGIAIFCPDYTVETFQSGAETGGTDGVSQGMRYLEWTHMQITGTSYITDIAYLLRHADGTVQVEHDRMQLGVFSRAHWRQACIDAGFEEPEMHLVASRDVVVARAR